MNTILSVIGLVTVAVITPGPNNFIIMSAAVRGGVRKSVPIGIGVITGSVVLLLLVWIGIDTVFAKVPHFQNTLRLCGALYLSYLGVATIFSKSGKNHNHLDKKVNGLPSSLLSVAIFQLINPKAWIIMITAVAAFSDAFSPETTLVVLVVIITIISTIGLSIWVWVGVFFSRRLNKHRLSWFQRILGCLLFVSAVSLLGF